jgi:membrane protein DedA with SNARE-associated domain
MNFTMFSCVTVIGSAVACCILAYLGERAHRAEPALLSNPEALVHFIRAQSRWILLVVVAFAVLYILALQLMKKSSR